MTEEFGKLILVGRPKKANAMATKRIRIAAFGPQNPIGNDKTVRLYCVPETGLAFRRVFEKEENTGILLAQTENFLVREIGPLCVCLEGTKTRPHSPPAQHHVSLC